MKMKSKKELVEELTADMLEECHDAMPKAVRAYAQIAVNKDWRKERRGEWIRDETYPTKNKKAYVCSYCGHYEVVPKGNPKMRYMNYCTDCGAMLKKPDVFDGCDT